MLRESLKMEGVESDQCGSVGWMLSCAQKVVQGTCPGCWFDPQMCARQEKAGTEPPVSPEEGKGCLSSSVSSATREEPGALLTKILY